MFIHRVIQIVS